MIMHLLFTLTSSIPALGSQAAPDVGQPQGKVLSLQQQIGVGSMTGIASAAITQPLLYFKNKLQQKHPIEWGFKVWYRGFPAYAGNITPVTAVQVAIDGELQAHMGKEKELKAYEKIAIGAAAGIPTAFIIAPTELALIQQQNSGKKYLELMKHMIEKHKVGVLLRGLFPTTLRECGFTTGYTAVFPLILASLSAHCDNKTVNYAASSIGAGVITTLVTHPFDVVKTSMQEDISKAKYQGPWDTVCKLYKAHGLRAFSAGIVPRGIGIIFEVGAMGSFKDLLTRSVIAHNEKKS